MYQYFQPYFYKGKNNHLLHRPKFTSNVLPPSLPIVMEPKWCICSDIVFGWLAPLPLLVRSDSIGRLGGCTKLPRPKPPLLLCCAVHCSVHCAVHRAVHCAVLPVADSRETWNGCSTQISSTQPEFFINTISAFFLIEVGERNCVLRKLTMNGFCLLLTCFHLVLEGVPAVHNELIKRERLLRDW